MAPTTLMSLSNDLLLCILDALEPDKEFDWDCSFEDRVAHRRCLLNFSATCKHLRSLIAPTAFRLLVVKKPVASDDILGLRHAAFYKYAQIEAFLDMVYSSKTVGACVR